MNDRPLTVLYLAQSHAEIRAGGSEVHARELYAAMRARPGVQPFLLARTGAPYANTPRPHEGTLTSVLHADDPGQHLFHHDDTGYDHFQGRHATKEHLTVFLHRFLTEVQPDVVHVHQTSFLGYDVLRQIRNSLPHAVIIHTLHDYLPMCSRDGQLLRTGDHERCLQASPRRCNECFPHIAPREFFLRERFIKTQLALVDAFICPSRFLLERYADWGLPRDKLHHVPYGRPSLPAAADPAGAPRERWRFAFFGQMSAYKGVLTLLQAMQMVQATSHGAARLWLHGNNVDLQSPEFRRQFALLFDEVRLSTCQAGPYPREQLPRLLQDVDWVVVPSLWWENLPLVIQEAFQCGRPVICSDVGGMAEAVADGVNGLHFRAGDAASLAAVMHRAATTPGLWEKLRRGAPVVPTVDTQAEWLANLYQQLREERHAAALV